MSDIEALYRQHSGTVYRFALSLSGNAAVAQDITSETFIRVWAARDRLDLSTVVGYLLTIARHLHLQAAARDRRHAAIDADPADPRPSAIRRTESRTELDAVLADLQTLPEPDRAALLMRAHDDMPYEEVARALGMTTGAAKVKVHRARRRLLALREARWRTT